MTHTAHFRYADDESARLDITMDGETDTLVIMYTMGTGSVELNGEEIDTETARKIIGKIASTADVDPGAVNQTLSLLDEIDA